MKDIIRIVKSLEYSGLLFHLVKQSKMRPMKKEEFISMLLGTLGASLLGNILAGRGIDRVGEGVIRAGYENRRGQKR